MNRFSIRRHKARRGQTIVIALLVLLLLAFVGGLFVTIVARNLVNAHGAGTVQTADDYAQSGIRFVDDQLRNSVEGADWRPPLVPTVNISQNDPDRDYLLARYARYTTGNGRFLVKVTYDPLGSQFNTAHPLHPSTTDPLSRYIKIESVGREGAIDPTDPTTFSTTTRTIHTAKLVAYKAIGITDYARFITDIDRRSDVASIGVPSIYDTTRKVVTTPGVFDFYGANSDPRAAQIQSYGITTTLGAPDAYLSETDPTTGFTFLRPNPTAGTATSGNSALSGGGSLRSNTSVRFYGMNTVYLNRPSSTSATAPTLGEQMEINGDLILDHFDPSQVTTSPAGTDLTKQASLVTFVPSDTTQGPFSVFPSSDPSFQTFGGAIRDGRSGASGNDINGFARQIKRLDPPKIDNVDSVTNMTRYREMAINSPVRQAISTAWTTTIKPDASSNGYGQTVYINNTSDVQSESLGITGGGTLVDQWLNRGIDGDNPLTAKGGWIGDVYVPPGVEIILGRLPVSAGTGQPHPYGVTLIRHDIVSTGNNIYQWPNPDDSQGSDSKMYIPFRDFYPNGVNPNRDIVIVAEGNVRVHGIVSADPNDSPAPSDTDDQLSRHVTIVTNATAYIDGSVLKGNPDSSIAVLARDYVCVNTTQFTAGPLVSDPPVNVPQPKAVQGQGLMDFTPGAEGLDPFLVQEFNFSLPNGGTPSTSTGGKLALYYSAQPDATGGGGIGSTDVKFSLYNPKTDSVVSSTPALTDPTADVSGFSKLVISALVHNTVDISNLPLDSAGTRMITNLLEDEPIQLWTGRLKDPAAIAGHTNQLQLERVAVLPMDIRIEAVLYAQNKSFFVIPGQWFNTDASDTVKNYATTTSYTSIGSNKYISRGKAIDYTDLNQTRYPFNGQPIDMKVIISGAVSEARPADISSQNAWMQKWGWIPHFHGSMLGGMASRGEPPIPAEVAGHNNGAQDGPSAGLTIIYNPQCAFPYTYTAATFTATPLRQDIYGNPLPFAPRLPVCEGLLYAGQAADDRP